MTALVALLQSMANELLCVEDTFRIRRQQKKINV